MTKEEAGMTLFLTSLRLLGQRCYIEVMNFGLQSLVLDISVSMFKVATVINHPRLKSELETLAVSIAVAPCPNNIFSAENLINLGREAGEIKPINAIVLIRELENLRKGLSVSLLHSQDADIDISSKFIHKNKDNASPSPVTTVVSGGQEEKPAAKIGQVKTPVPQGPGGARTKRTTHNRKSFLISDRDRVYQYIAGHKEVKLKELESAFNEVSGRTVRRVTESLIKEGKIERVGSPGPASFYRLVSPSTRSADASFSASFAPASPVKAETSLNTNDARNDKEEKKKEERAWIPADIGLPAGGNKENWNDEDSWNKGEGNLLFDEGGEEIEMAEEASLVSGEKSAEGAEITNGQSKERESGSSLPTASGQIGSFRPITRADDLLKEKARGVEIDSALRWNYEKRNWENKQRRDLGAARENPEVIEL